MASSTIKRRQYLTLVAHHSISSYRECALSNLTPFYQWLLSFLASLLRPQSRPHELIFPKTYLGLDIAAYSLMDNDGVRRSPWCRKTLKELEVNASAVVVQHLPEHTEVGGLEPNPRVEPKSISTLLPSPTEYAETVEGLLAQVKPEYCRLTAGLLPYEDVTLTTYAYASSILQCHRQGLPIARVSACRFLEPKQRSTRPTFPLVPELAPTNAAAWPYDCLDGTQNFWFYTSLDITFGPAKFIMACWNVANNYDYAAFLEISALDAAVADHHNIDTENQVATMSDAAWSVLIMHAAVGVSLHVSADHAPVLECIRFRMSSLGLTSAVVLQQMARGRAFTLPALDYYSLVCCLSHDLLEAYRDVSGGEPDNMAVTLMSVYGVSQLELVQAFCDGLMVVESLCPVWLGLPLGAAALTMDADRYRVGGTSILSNYSAGAYTKRPARCLIPSLARFTPHSVADVESALLSMGGEQEPQLGELTSSVLDSCGLGNITDHVRSARENVRSAAIDGRFVAFFLEDMREILMRDEPFI